MIVYDLLDPFRRNFKKSKYFIDKVMYMMQILLIIKL